jgi:hypothetical protein
VKIILDSTVYRADLLLQGNAFRIFLPALERIGAKLVVPAIVFEEVANGFRESVEKYMELLKNVTNKGRRLGFEDMAFTFPKERAGVELAKYRRYLTSRLKVENMEIPNVPHETLVRRALDRRKPFTEKGTGYRDALIWETVLQVAEQETSMVYFVTGNTHDFCLGGNLHPDLVHDLEQRQIPENRLKLFDTLDNLNVALVLPKLQHLESVLKEMEKDEWGSFRLEDWILNNLGELLRDERIAGHLSKLASEGSVVHGPTIKIVKQHLIDDVREIPDGNILVGARTGLVVELAIGQKGEDAFGEMWSEIKAWPGFYGFGITEQQIDVEVEFSLVVDPENHQVVSAQIDEVEGEQEAGRLILNSHPVRC